MFGTIGMLFWWFEVPEVMSWYLQTLELGSVAVTHIVVLLAVGV